MNTNNTILTIIVIIALLLATLCGCMETNTAQSNEDEVEVDKEINEESAEACELAPIEIMINSDTDFKDEVIKHIKNSRTPNKENRGAYSAHKISEIKEFYRLDNFMIHGYNLFRVDVGDVGFVYHLAPIEMIEIYGERFVSEFDIIKIIISRPEYQHFSVSEWLESGSLTDDNFMYKEQYNNISAQIGDAIFTITSPDELNSYEYLRDLAFKLIETAELVVVGE